VERISISEKEEEVNDPKNILKEPSPYFSIEGEGYIGRDCFGRVFFDACESEEQHLVNPKMKPGAERPGCRHYLEDLVPNNLIGKQARVTVTIHFTPPEN
jgi:hypothetical protein